MKIHLLIAALAASLALAAPADAAPKKHKKQVHRAQVHRAVQAPGYAQSQDVYVNGELIGRDPDPNIRAFMMRNPHIWDGPE